jgi:hypothetical protein
MATRNAWTFSTSPVRALINSVDLTGSVDELERWERLAALLELPSTSVITISASGPVITLLTPSYRFTVAWSSSGTVATVAEAPRRLRSHEDAIRLVATPFMGESGRARCDEAGVGWFDLSGNASIRAPGLRIAMDGRPNAYVRRGRPSTPFAPKAARLTRTLLMHHPEALRQSQLAAAARLSEAYTSIITRRLIDDRLVDRLEDNRVRARDPELLRDAWAEAYRFDQHQVTRGTVAARSGEALLERVASAFATKSADRSDEVPYAATGLAAAWLHQPLAGFRIVTVFARRRPPRDTLDALGFIDEPRGANLWIVVPKDDGVFDGAKRYTGIVATHPVQTYVDLHGQPERADEAAEHLRLKVLNPSWSRSD